MANEIALKLHISFSAKNKLCGQLIFFIAYQNSFLCDTGLPIAMLSFVTNSYVGPILVFKTNEPKTSAEQPGA